MDRMIPPRETLEIEFKSDKNKLPDSDLIDAVVAFANTNGGDLYLGVEDNGDVTGLHPSHRDITQLAAFIANKLIGYNYMFLERGDGTPYEIIRDLVGGSPVLYPMTVVLLFVLYIAAFYFIFFLIRRRKGEVE